MSAPVRFSRLAQQAEALAPTPPAAGHNKAAQALLAKPSEPNLLSTHDDAALRLHLAAEVEHALMVEYLYAGFSLNENQSNQKQQSMVQKWRKTIMGIAREEMGHLVTVQNMLQLIGAPLTFTREDLPFDNGYQPFTFRLEPLSQKSLAKYVVAEMPAPEYLDRHHPELWAELQPIIALATKGNNGQVVNRVGEIYEALQKCFDQLSAADIQADSLPFQASADVWGLGNREILILTATDRKSAKQALLAVSEQGEGDTLDESPGALPSHFSRFLDIYREFPTNNSWQPVHPVPTDPWTKEVKLDELSSVEAEALMWARLANERYRMVLLYLLHALHVEASAKTTHGLLVSWSFGEMYSLRSISDILTTLPMWDPNDKAGCAASPFEMPYSLDLPNREADRWRLHRDQLLNCGLLINRLIDKQPQGSHASYLRTLQQSDEKTLAIINGMIRA